MGKSNKSITKCCPFCEIQVHVACKTCPNCKHSIYNAKQRSLTPTSVMEDLGLRRRTERVKREKPNYYDASEFEKKKKKRRMERSASDSLKERGRPTTQALKRKRKKKGIGGNFNSDSSSPCGLSNSHKSFRDSEEDEPPMILAPEKVSQFSVVLAELNRKMYSTTWTII